MNRFLTDLKTRYPTLEFASVEELLERAERARIPLSVAEELSPVVLIPYKVRDVLQVALRRNLELANAFVSVFNAELYIPLFVLARAVVETGALALDVWDRVNDIGGAGDKTGLPALDEHLAKALLGAKTSITPEDVRGTECADATGPSLEKARARAAYSLRCPIGVRASQLSWDGCDVSTNRPRRPRGEEVALRRPTLFDQVRTAAGSTQCVGSRLDHKSDGD